MNPSEVHKTARRIHDDIQQMLQVRTARGQRHEALEEAVKARGAAVWGAMKRHPFLSMAVIGACGVGVAASIGVAELALGAALALAAYKVLREGEPPMQALQEVEHELRA
ncbi:MAG TPA: hypothetical protein VF765_05370 [Polyangiaceae bacterium]